MKKEDISKKLSKFRLFLGLNQTQFAKKLEIPRTTIIGYESGNSIPSDFLLRLHTTFNLNIEWFLFDKGLPVILKTPTAQDLTNNVVRNITEKNRIKLKEDVSDVTKENLKNKPTCWLNDATNVAPVGKETKLSEQTDIQSSLEDLARQALAPDLKKINEQIVEKEKEIATYEKRIAEIERLLKKEFGKAEETKSPDTIYATEPIVEYSATEDDIKTVDLPLAENLAAGVPIEACYNCETYAVPSKFLKKNKRYCVAKIKGTSMTDVGIADGSVVLLEYTNQANSGDIAVVTHDGYTTLKRLHQKDDGSWELRYEDGSGALIPLKDGAWDVLGAFVRVL